ncbi:MAG: ImmA/IrrE family metallo-endopeptidase [Bdellovibrionales bacterium]|nr:ImmA/IrrE family metallo-endopeptidase [Bdellovibrionales bacterium]
MNKIPQINTEILKKCREQMGVSYSEVKKKVPTIIEIEKGKKSPTPPQLTKLEELYQVPRWVFIAKKLPLEYQYEKKPSFRKFKKSEAFNSFKIRRLLSKVEQYRNLFLELRQDLDEPIQPFKIPFTPSNSAEETAKQVRKWLNLKEPLDFDSYRKKIEEQNIFIFMTSKFQSWAKADRESFRGMSIFHDRLPLIIINDSDYKKARSFTLFHELGHLLKKKMSINCESINNKEEKWCDELAGCILIPSKSEFQNFSFKTLSDLEKGAKKFKVSTYAFLVRLKHLKLISQSEYQKFEKQLREEFNKLQKKFKKNPPPLSRNRSKETRFQFGNGFVRTVMQVLNNKELTLYKASKILDLKVPQVLKLSDQQ